MLWKPEKTFGIECKIVEFDLSFEKKYLKIVESVQAIVNRSQI